MRRSNDDTRGAEFARRVSHALAGAADEHEIGGNVPVTAKLPDHIGTELSAEHHKFDIGIRPIE